MRCLLLVEPNSDAERPGGLLRGVFGPGVSGREELGIGSPGGLLRGEFGTTRRTTDLFPVSIMLISLDITSLATTRDL